MYITVGVADLVKMCAGIFYAPCPHSSHKLAEVYF